MSESASSMPFLMHLEELRRRFLRASLAYILILGVCLYFSSTLFAVLQKPLLPHLSEDAFFMAVDAVSGWRVYIDVALFGSLVLIFPYVLFELWAFVTPGLKSREKTILIPIVFLMTLFFAGGIIFAYTIALPFTFAFLVKVYAGTPIRYLPNIESYLSFVLKTLFAFGLLFQLPFLVLFLQQSGVLKRPTLTRARPFVYVAAFVVGAILTPPDVVSQIVMAVPFILLFEFGMVLARITNPKIP